MGEVGLPTGMCVAYVSCLYTCVVDTLIEEQHPIEETPLFNVAIPPPPPQHIQTLGTTQDFPRE